MSLIIRYRQIGLGFTRYAHLNCNANGRFTVTSWQTECRNRTIGRLRLFAATTSSSKSALTNPQSNSLHLKWRVLARLVYYIRLPFLVLSVYGIGYQQGIIDYSRDSARMEVKLLDTILAGVGCISYDDRAGVLVAREGEWRNLLDRFRSTQNANGEGYDDEYARVVMLRNVSLVGERIVKVARTHVKSKLTEAVKDATAKFPPEVLDDEVRLYEALENDEEVEGWTNAMRHMEGPWKYVLIPTPLPNAFVSEILPHRIFITTSLLQKFIATQDELALVLGHEISHLILGHSSSQNSLETSFRTIEILLLSIDPTEGLLSLVFMTFLASIRGAIGASYSRENEREADELGIKLTAMACYDTKEASRVFHKMHMQDVESGLGASAGRIGLLSFFDTHPPSDERFRSLLEGSKSENAQKYEDTSCSTLKRLFWDVMKPEDFVNEEEASAAETSSENQSDLF